MKKNEKTTLLNLGKALDENFDIIIDAINRNQKWAEKVDSTNTKIVKALDRERKELEKRVAKLEKKK